MAANGRLLPTSLVTVQTSTYAGRTVKLQLSTKAAKGFKAAKAAFAKVGKTLTVVPPGGAYRSYAVQDEMRRGSLGNVALARKWNLNPHSSVPLAAAGYSSHGTGLSFDALINGSAAPSQASIDLLRQYGFVRTYGAKDPNHFTFQA